MSHVFDGFSRTCLDVIVGTYIGGARMAREMDRVVPHGYPWLLVS